MKRLLFLVVLTMFCGCSSDEEEEMTINSSFLTGSSSKTWYITDYSSAGGAPFNEQPVCVQDDRWIFSADGTMEQNEGATKCQASDPQIYVEGTWELFPETKVLRLTRNNIINFSVTKLTETELKVTNGSDFINFSKE